MPSRNFNILAGTVLAGAIAAGGVMGYSHFTTRPTAFDRQVWLDGARGVHSQDAPRLRMADGLVRDGRLELDAQVPETELALVRAGQTAEISSDQVGEATGRVRIVTSEVDAANRLGTARISLTGGAFRPGMFARARIQVGDQPAVTVPTASVLYRENRAGVFVMGGDSRAHFQPVTVLSRTADQTAVAGLTAGSRVVVAGAGFLGEGDRVTVTAAPRAAAPVRAAAPAKNQ